MTAPHTIELGALECLEEKAMQQNMSALGLIRQVIQNY